MSARHVAFLTLQAIESGAFADVALDRALKDYALSDLDRRLATELIYGCVRRQRTLDRLLDQFGDRPANQQAPALRHILHIGFYQLRYLNHIPAAAAVDTTVELVKQQRLGGLSNVANGILRQYLRKAVDGDPLTMPDARAADRSASGQSASGQSAQTIGITHSFPDWIVDRWQQQLPAEEVPRLADWFNQSPTIDLRINPLRTSLDAVAEALAGRGLDPQPIDLPPDLVAGLALPFSRLPQGIRLRGSVGPIQKLPGFHEGHWMVQDASAQVVSHCLDPQPDERIIDACAAPGGKTLHIGELIGDRGEIWACDQTASRLRKLKQNADRLAMYCIKPHQGDSRGFTDWQGQADRVLVDAPCSGLGTLHRHADSRWRQTPENIDALAQLQFELLDRAATWVKPGGRLVYATCTLHPQENQGVIDRFLSQSAQTEAWQPRSLEIWPHRAHMDGFFIAILDRPKAP
jgi:16S rRNA (cytosine967-C5)-methyltransferase